MEPFTVRERIVETVNKLFVYTDNRDWELMQNDVFTPEVHLDMTSLGGAAESMSSAAICEMWSQGFEGIDQMYHLQYKLKYTQGNTSLD